MPRLPSVETHLDEAIEEWLIHRANQGRKRGTLEQYRWAIGLFRDFVHEKVADREPTLDSDVDKSMIRGFRHELLTTPIKTPIGTRHGKPLAQTTQHVILRTLKNFLAWCVDEDLIPANPFPRGEMPRLPDRPGKTPSREEVSRLLATAGKTGPDIGSKALAARSRAMLYLLLDTGLRVSEVVNLDMSDYDRVRGRLYIRDSKAERSRYVYLSPEARIALDSWLRRQRNRMLAARSLRGDRRFEESLVDAIRPDDEPQSWSSDDEEPALFLNRDGHRMTVGAVRQWLDELCKRSGIASYTPHALRRFYITQAAANGMPIPQLQQHVGHSQIRTTQRYISRDEERVRESALASSPLHALSQSRR